MRHLSWEESQHFETATLFEQKHGSETTLISNPTAMTANIIFALEMLLSQPLKIQAMEQIPVKCLFKHFGAAAKVMKYLLVQETGDPQRTCTLSRGL
jgi:hypothetical protein